ncbi:hypothetical protein MOBT1_002440 [Malassezia obtusa]|uniref:Uncharacterized protein n=1 Tax=Malassezia obtusa TaxID=76774 RepID=A0AAF0E1M9_9BASI|nr:hypothetical protein MOBT1_002440 [Malassezia obtusa]
MPRRTPLGELAPREWAQRSSHASKSFEALDDVPARRTRSRRAARTAHASTSPAPARREAPPPDTRAPPTPAQREAPAPDAPAPEAPACACPLVAPVPRYQTRRVADLCADFDALSLARRAPRARSAPGRTPFVVFEDPHALTYRPAMHTRARCAAHDADDKENDTRSRYPPMDRR